MSGLTRGLTGTEETVRADLVVAGAGIAGLTAALWAAHEGLRVVVLNKGPGWDVANAEQPTSTFYAQGGVAVVMPGAETGSSDNADSVDRHLADTVAAGGGLTDAAASGPILADGWDSVSALIGWGAEFDRDTDGLLLRTREGGHTRRRIIHAGGDATGAAIQRALHEAVRQTAGGDVPPIRFLDDTIATAIHLDDGRAVGVACLRDGRPTSVLAPTVLLATGGAGHLYAATTNPAGATCDGIALALRAGAQVSDLEFIQFHPTMLYTAGARGRRTLISEAVRGEGGRLIDVDGRSVTAGVHPMGDLAPRDVVADAVQTAIELTGHPCVYLDIADVGDFEARFPTVTAGVRAAGLDPASGRIPVVPGAHYLCGGVVTDESSRTAVDGLLAAGEVARTGLHGANRLASNSLLEGLVMGRRAAAVAVARREIPVPECAELKAEQPVPVLDREQLQNMMTRHVALRRSAAGLAEVAATLAAAPRRTADSVRDIEDAALTLTASAVVAAAAARTESRGAHVRTDYPLTADVAESRVFRIVDGELREARPVGLPG
ncbi:L-aspartate oxidase [Gordonia sp. JH63]|uniref:L-aspartate oxidase n=1 Tax=Gordonia TaxID=2053 RepID=UPI00071CD6E8|nr:MULTISPECIES: L-aspartate oxidase [unclassified Gordonia (in: high G+C Gram-positive bacteria)]KSU52551.1 L-aspartate oxidase [Gordonia sp. SGD-V-85]QHD87674.1 L-aspartate oxidase [Gordonia sp. JH63]SCC58351.1 L-aspartate oxidase [Gordonia sp. v-85]